MAGSRHERGFADEEEWNDDVEPEDEDLEDIEEDDDDEEEELVLARYVRGQEALDTLTPEDTVAYLQLVGQEAVPRWLNARGQISMPTEMECRVCGCTDKRGCAGGCVWAAPNLCSRCVA